MRNTSVPKKAWSVDLGPSRDLEATSSQRKEELDFSGCVYAFSYEIQLGEVDEQPLTRFKMRLKAHVA